MDLDNLQCSLQGSESQDSDEPVLSGTKNPEDQKLQPINASPAAPSLTTQVSSKGVENAKKRLRAFSIQKKSPMQAAIIKPTSSGANCNTVLIGKLTSVKTTPKPERTAEDDVMKMPKPPKPGASRKGFQESYTEMRKKTLEEIETMKRKMELVELGIPLGLIGPANHDKGMPTKAMPPIRAFLDDAKLDAIIREAKRAKADGKEFKFDYRKFVPDYENPFQRKKEDPTEKKEADMKADERAHIAPRERDKDRDKRSDKRKKNDAFIEYSNRMDRLKERAENRVRDRSKEKDYKRDKNDKSKERDERHKVKADRGKETDTKTKEEAKKTSDKSDKGKDKNTKETKVNLNDYLVCDSWSLDNDANSSPQVSEKSLKIPLPKDFIRKNIDSKLTDSPKPRLEGLIDSFKYELDDNDEVLDIFDEETDLHKYSKNDVLCGSPVLKFDYTRDIEDISKESTNDDTFLESVIAEIKQETMSEDEDNHDKSLVEYDFSPDKEKDATGSVTPELELQGSQRSDYSDGYISVDSRKSSESGYKSTESFKNYKGDSSRERDFSLSVERELDEDLASKMSKSTVDSLEMWSFVMKICQPLLFRHDKNRCFKETRSLPHVWYSVKPRTCSCVKDRRVVYTELEACKMIHVDALYSTADEITSPPSPTSRVWYPPASGDPAPPPTATVTAKATAARRSMTPERGDEVLLDREYQKFMEAVEAAPKKEQSRSTTPVKQNEDRKKKKAEDDEEKRVKKLKLNEDWSQESEVEEEVVKRTEKKKK